MSVMESAAPRRRQLLAAVFVGGAIGTLVRAGLSDHLHHDPGAWPWATLIVNIAGSLLLGWWSTRLPRSSDIDPRLRPLLTTGVCGGLTTFSTLQLELVQMLDADRIALAAGYLAVTLATGLAAIVAGRAAADAIHTREAGTA